MGTITHVHVFSGVSGYWMPTYLDSNNKGGSLLIRELAFGNKWPVTLHVGDRMLTLPRGGAILLVEI